MLVSMPQPTHRLQPTRAVDVDLHPANFGDNEGTMFRVGETFTSPDGRIMISIDSETANDFEVTIVSSLPDLLFEDDFEAVP